MTTDTYTELRQRIARYEQSARETAMLVCLNPANAAEWRSETTKFRGLSTAAKAELAVALHAETMATV
jgi:hypothetical protein